MTDQDLKEKLFGANCQPEWGMVLGSGFDVWLNNLSPGERVPFQDVAGLRHVSVPGHGGYFTSGSVEGIPVVMAVGRLHLYEGLTWQHAVKPVETLLSMGASRILLTTAAGSVNQSFTPGDGVAITDHINLTGEDPHTGTSLFADTSSLYDPHFAGFLCERGLKAGVLAGVRGPSYETPAEAKALRILGADIVCMSTVLEALSLAQTGSRCAGVAVVANRAGDPGITHDDVLAVVGRCAEGFWPAVSALISSGSD